MLSNFGAFDVIHDQHMHREVEKLLKRVGFGSDKEKWKQLRKNGSRNNTPAKIFRSPKTDLEICSSLFTYLRSHLIYHEELTDGSPHAISLETILQLRRNTRKQRTMPLKQQMELALLWRTVSIILGFDYLSAVDFFREFLPQVKSLPPLSLSIYWSSVEGFSTNLVDIAGISTEQDASNGEIDLPILPIAELSYLNPRNGETDKLLSSQASVLEIEHTIREHDPLGVVQKLSDAAECLATALFDADDSDKSVLMEFELAVAVKSARASLLLSCASSLANNGVLLDGRGVDISYLDDIKEYVMQHVSREHVENSELLPSVDAATRLDGTKTDAYSILKEKVLRSFGANPGGLILSFGKADHGKLGHGDAQVNRAIPTVVETMQGYNIVKVASMSTYAVVVDAEGRVFVWGTGGSSGSMQGLRTDIVPQPLEALSEKMPVRDVACGLGHALFLMANGRVCSWGNGGNGRLGLGDTSDRAEACMIKDLAGEVIQSVHCGASHSMAVVKRTGRVYTWGKNTQGQCGRGNLEDLLRPMLNTTLKNDNVVKMAAGWEHSIALTSTGRVYSWGSGYKDSRRGLVPPVLGLGHSEGRTLPEMLSSIENVRIIDIASGWDHCIALDDQRRVLTWGSGQNGKLGHATEENVTTPCIVPSLEHIKVVAISAGCEHSAVIAEDGTLYTWGHGDGGRLGHGDNEAKSTPTPVEALQQMHARPIVVSCGDKFTMIVVEPYSDDAEFKKRQLKSSERSEGSKVRVSHSSVMGECLSMAYIHRVVDQTICAKPTRAKLHRAATSLTDLAALTSEDLPSSPVTPSFTSQTISFGDKRFGFSAESDSPVTPSGPVHDVTEGPTGKEVLLSLLSLMSRSFDSTAYESYCDYRGDNASKLQSPKKPNLASPYSIEIVTQTFLAINSILASQMDSLFEKDFYASNVSATSGGKDKSAVMRATLPLGIDKYVAELQQLIDPVETTRGGARGAVIPFAGEMTTWAILRCALNCLQQNLYALNAISLAESCQTLSLQTVAIDHPIVSKFENSRRDPVESEFQTHVPNAERIVGILHGTMEDRDLRSSEDEDDEDDDEDEDDDDDEAHDDDEDSDNDDEEEEEDYEQSGDILDDVENGEREDGDLYGDFDVNRIPYDEVDDEDNAEDVGTSGDDHSGLGRISVGDISRGTRSDMGDFNEGGGDTRSIRSRQENRQGTDDSGICAIDESGDEEFQQLEIAGEASEEEIRDEDGRSPAFSQESFDFALPRTSDDIFDDAVDIDIDENGNVRQQDEEEPVGGKGQNASEQDLLGGLEQEEFDEDLQKAIFSSLDATGADDPLQNMLSTKIIGDSADVIPKLSGQLEYMARRCHDAILVCRSTTKGDSVALMSLWLDIQNSIALGFRAMYSVDEQRELMISVMVRTEEWMHILPGVVMGLERGSSFGFLAKDVFVDINRCNSKGSQKELVKESSSEDIMKIDIPKLCVMLNQLREQQLTCKDIINDLLLQGDFETMGVVVVCDSSECGTLGDSTLLAQDGHKFVLSYSLLSLVQISVSYFLMQKFGAVTSEMQSQRVWGPHLNSLFITIVDMVEYELDDIVSCLPALSVWCESDERFDRMKVILMKILRNSATSVLLACVGGIASSSYVQVENSLAFLPHARRLLQIYRTHCTAVVDRLGNERSGRLVACIQEWLLNEMRCIILFVSSTIGLCKNTATASNMGDDKFLLSKCYRSCVSSIVDASVIVKSDAHPIWRRLGSHVKSWSQLGLNYKYQVNSDPTGIEYLAEWSQVLEVVSVDYTRLFDTSFGAKWFVDLILALPKVVIETIGSNDSSFLCDILGTDCEILGLIVMTEIDSGPEEISVVFESPVKLAHAVVAEMEGLHGPAFVIAFKEWIWRCKLATHAIIMTMSGEHRNCSMYMQLTANGNAIAEGSRHAMSMFCQNWLVCTVLVGIAVKRVQKIFPFSSTEQLTSYMAQVELQYAGLLRSSLKESYVARLGSVLLESDALSVLKSQLAWLRCSLELRTTRGYNLTEDLQLDLEKTCPDEPTFGSPSSEYLTMVSDVGTILFGDLSVSRLEEISVVAHICDRNTCFAAELCSEALTLLSCSESASLYFVDGLQIEGLGPTMSKIKNEKDHQSISPTLVKSGDRKGEIFTGLEVNEGSIKQAIVALDDTVDTLVKSVKRSYCRDSSNEASESLLMIPSLIEALNLGICTSLRRHSVHIGSSQKLQLKSPASGFAAFMDIIFSICGSPTSLERDTKFWGALAAFGQFMVASKSLGFVCLCEGDDSKHQSDLEMLELSSDVLYVLSRVIHGLCDMKMKLLRNCKSTKTNIILPQIRPVDFSSPVVLPNSSTEQGNYNLGFWIKIPTGHCDAQHQNAKANAETLQSQGCVKTHILSRVPEAGEVDMNSLFKDLPVTMCNPGVVLETSPDGKSVIVVKITTCLQKGSFKPNKPIRIVKLSSLPLATDTWLDISIQFTSLSPLENMAGAEAERSLVQLFVNGELHVSAEDSFGRPSLHQNVIFGTTPISLIQPIGVPYLQAGNVRWSSQSAFDATGYSAAGKVSVTNDASMHDTLRKSLENTFPADCASIMLDHRGALIKRTIHQVVEIKVQFEPMVCTQRTLLDVMSTAESCMSMFTSSMTIALRNAFNDIGMVLDTSSTNSALVQKKSDHICDVIAVFPIIAKWAVGFVGVGDGQNALHEVSFDVVRNYVSALEWCKEIDAAYRAKYENYRICDNINKEIDTAVSALRTIVAYMVAIVGIIVASSSIEFPMPMHGVSDSDKETWRQWLGRVKAHREVYDSQFIPTHTQLGVRLNSEGNPLRQNENVIVTGVAAICTQAIKAGLLTVSDITTRNSPTKGQESDMHLQMISLFCAGGWPASLRGNSIVDLQPRALFLHQDTKSLEHAVFPSSAAVHSVFSPASGRPGVVWIHQCAGGYSRSTIDTDDSLPPDSDDSVVYSAATSSLLLPRSVHTLLPTTEMVSSRDTIPPLAMSHMAQFLLSTKLGSDGALLSILAQLSSTAAKQSSTVNDLTSAVNGGSAALSLTVFMAHVRSILVQIAMVEALDTDEQLKHLSLLRDLCERDVRNLIAIASLDPVSSVIDAFQSASKNTSGNSQLDVLSNLLREGDVNFLEKITLRVWRHFHAGSPRSRAGVGLSSDNPAVGPAAIAGDVQIVGNRIRALSHFPSVQVLPVHLEKMSGRWFYECTLLTDGLMQIGWADRAFRCDPVCGQGVGDHLHSWAVDGLRTKKWNVSCDSYGTRWKAEDIVGVLVDMDLLEMKFFLNGTDLGSAFTNFTATGLYPAISLNVRQCLRVNYGQEKFMFPPTEVDGLPFKPVNDALKIVKDMNSLLKGPSISITPASTARSIVSNTATPLLQNPAESKGEFSPPVRADDYDMTVAMNISSSHPTTSVFVTDSPRPVPSLGVDGTSETGREGDNDIVDRVIDHSITVDDEEEGDGARSARRRGSTSAGEWRMGSRQGGRSRRGSRDVNGLPVSSLTSAANVAVAAASTVEADDDDTTGTGSNHESRDNFFGQQHQTTTSTPEMEARRQLLIENLIGMGFPVDWALRAAEHCDAAVSESNAIAWIIERMELEQAKLEELEGGDSRVADEEDYDDMEDVGVDHSNRYGYGAGSNDDGKEDGDDDALGRPRPLPLAGAGVRLPSQPAPPGYTRSGHKLSSAGAEAASKDSGSNSFQDQGTWNNEAPMYSSLLVGHQSARRRFDMDKQAVLLQISELDFCDLFPIVLSCQFSLCVFYARAAFIRLLRITTRLGYDEIDHSFSSPARKEVSALACALRDLVLTNSEDASLPLIVELLGVCFKQGLGASAQPEKLFPSLLQGTLSGDPIDLSPPISPFTSLNSLLFTNILTRLEMDVFGFYGKASPGNIIPKSLSSIAIDESSLQSSGVTLEFARQITMAAFSLTSAMSGLCGELVGAIVNECVDTFEMAAQGKYDRRDWISFGSERLSPDAESPHTRVAELAKAPKVLWAFSTMCVIIQEIKKHVSVSLSSEDASHSSACLENILHPQKVARLLKTTAISPNTSLSFCVYGVCSEILSCVNRKILVLEKLLLSASIDVDPITGESSQELQKPFLKLAALGQQELKQSAQYYSVVTSGLASTHSRSDAVSFEYRALRNLSNRLVTEYSQYRVNSKHTRTMSTFLLEVLTLRRAFTGIASMSSNIHYDVIEDWVVPLDLGGQTLTYNDSSSSLSHDKLHTVASTDGPASQINISVTQISANSITVSWSGIPEDEDWNSALNKSTPTSSGRIAASVGGILATIKGGNTTAPAAHTSYSLYVTPISGAIHLPVSDDKNRDSLVLPFVSSKGSQKIDLLDPDTLYRVSLTSDDTKRKSSPPHKGPDEPKPLFAWSSSILRHSKSHVDTKSDSSKAASIEDITPEKYIMVSTIGEALFLLDSSAATCPVPLQVENHGLSVRNTVSKKWSTIRSTVRLSSGTHRWEVMIDRCISKNIFIGVVGPDARPDNYVGCDKHGWAFLANRAIWHNKGKLKSYGELFRTGDMVSVILDLDQGTLSFAINGKDLGVAVDGLTGPLYPAFSLYNQYDQISLSPPRQPAVENDTVGGCRWGTSSAERVIQRMEILQIMLRCCAHGRSVSRALDKKVSRSGAKRLVGALHSPLLVTELARRWALWKNDIVLRTVRADGDIITILVSASLSLTMSENRYRPGDVVQWENGHYTVLGVGRHRLWMQRNGNGEVIGFSRDTLHQLNSKNSLRLIKKSNMFKASLKADIRAINLLDDSCINTANDDEAADIISIREDDLEDAALMRRALIGECDQWGQEDDKILIEWIDLRARAVGCHPLNIRFHDIYSPASVLAKMHVSGSSQSSPASQAFCRRFECLANKHTNLSIRLRAMYLLHFNDILAPLLPLVFDGSFRSIVSATTDDVTLSLSSLLLVHRDIILAEVKFGYGFRLAWSTAIGCATPVTSGSKSDITKTLDPTGGRVAFSMSPVELPVLPQRGMSRDPLVKPLVSTPLVYIPDKETPSRKVYGGLSTVQFEDNTLCFMSSSQAQTVASVDVVLHDTFFLVSSTMKFARNFGRESVYGDDYRWRLLGSYQCSLLGQLMQSFECSDQYQIQVAALPGGSAVGGDDVRRPGDGTWETVLRSVCRGGIFWEDSLPPKNRPVCLNVKFKLQTSKKNVATCGSRLMKLLILCNSNMARESESDPGDAEAPTDLSQWSILQTYVGEALEEVQPIFLSSIFFADNDSPVANEEDILGVLLRGDLIPDGEAGMINILLHIMHATGALLGIAFRSGVSVPLHMSDYFWAVLCSESVPRTSRNGSDVDSYHNKFCSNVREACARALRHGFNSTVPETLLDLFYKDELRVLMCSGGVLNPVVLRAQAILAPPLQDTDNNVEMFWAAMSDLPRLCIMKLLQSLWLLHTADLPDELFFWKDNAELLGNFRVGLIEGSGSDFSIDPVYSEVERAGGVREWPVLCELNNQQPVMISSAFKRHK